MSQTQPEQKVRFENPTPYNTAHDAKQAHVNKQIAAEWLDLEKHVGWHGGYRLDQVVCRHNEDGWLLILKAHRNGRAYVAFLQTESLPEAYEFGGELAARGLLTWQHDKWPSRWLKETLGIK